MKVAFDLHGVMDRYPKQYAELAELVLSIPGNEVHIVTGLIEVEGVPLCLEAGIEYTHYFSIVDYHTDQGTQVEWKENGRGETTPFMDNEKWDRTKADYCERMGITMIFDDSPVYGKYFNGDCLYLLQKNHDRSFWEKDLSAIG